MALLQQCLNNSQNTRREGGLGRPGSGWWQKKQPNSETPCDQKTPRTLDPILPALFEKDCFPLRSFLSQRKTTLPFQFQRGKTYSGKWNMSWSFWLCNSIVNSESGWNVVIMSNHSSNWVGQANISPAFDYCLLFASLKIKSNEEAKVFNTGRENRDIFITY